MAKDKLAKADTFAALTVAEGNISPMEIIEINLGGAVNPKNLTKIKVPSGGALAFEVPNLSGEVEYEKELTGVIVGIGSKRVYYSTRYTGDKVRPDCASNDAKTGTAADGCNLGGVCENCPMNEWGTAKDDKGNPTNGKACQERKVILLMTKEAVLPIMLECPTGSLQPVTKFLTDLSAVQKLYFHVVTRFKLTKETSGSGVDYSSMAPGFVRDLEPEEKPGAFSVWKTMNKMVCAMGAELSESIDEEDQPW